MCMDSRSVGLLQDVGRFNCGSKNIYKQMKNKMSQWLTLKEKRSLQRKERHVSWSGSDIENFQNLMLVRIAPGLPEKPYFNIDQGQTWLNETSKHGLFICPEHTLYISFIKENNRQGAF